MASIDFSKVNKIVIPEGQVQMIQQTSDGTVLWGYYEQLSYQYGYWFNGKAGGLFAQYQLSGQIVPPNIPTNYKYFKFKVEGGTYQTDQYCYWSGTTNLPYYLCYNNYPSSTNISNKIAIPSIVTVTATSGSKSVITVSSGETDWIEYPDTAIRNNIGIDWSLLHTMYKSNMVYGPSSWCALPKVTIQFRN